MKVRNDNRTQDTQALAATRQVPPQPLPPSPADAAPVDTVAVDLTRNERSARIREKLGTMGPMVAGADSDATVEAMRQRLLGQPSSGIFDLGGKDPAQTVLALLG